MSAMTTSLPPIAEWYLKDLSPIRPQLPNPPQITPLVPLGFLRRRFSKNSDSSNDYRIVKPQNTIHYPTSSTLGAASLRSQGLLSAVGGQQPLRSAPARMLRANDGCLNSLAPSPLPNHPLGGNMPRPGSSYAPHRVLSVPRAPVTSSSSRPAPNVSHSTPVAQGSQKYENGVYPPKTAAAKHQLSKTTSLPTPLVSGTSVQPPTLIGHGIAPAHSRISQPLPLGVNPGEPSSFRPLTNHLGSPQSIVKGIKQEFPPSVPTKSKRGRQGDDEPPQKRQKSATGKKEQSLACQADWSKSKALQRGIKAKTTIHPYIDILGTDDSGLFVGIQWNEIDSIEPIGNVSKEDIQIFKDRFGPYSKMNILGTRELDGKKFYVVACPRLIGEEWMKAEFIRDYNHGTTVTN